MAAQTISDYLVNSFDRALHRSPQMGGLLKGSVRVVTGIMAEDHRFPGLGKVTAITRGALQPIIPQPGGTARPVAHLEPKEHYAHLDEYQMAQTNVNAMVGYGMNSRQAVERACDQWIIDAFGGTGQDLNTQALGAPIPAIGNTYNSPLHPLPQTTPPTTPNGRITLGKLVAAMTALLRRGVGKKDMLTVVYPQSQFENITGITQLISRDYSERGFIASGEPPPLFGMKWIGVEDREGEGGISHPTIIAKNGVGLALGNVENMRDISWRNDINSWQIGAKLLGGATAIDKEMIVQVAIA